MPFTEKKKSILLETGDIVCFCKGISWLSRAIRFFSRTAGEDPAACSHVGIMVNKTEIVEALHKTVKRSLIDSINGFKGVVEIYRPRIPLGIRQRLCIRKKADDYIGRRYGYLKIVAHALDYFLGGRYIFRSLARSQRYPICSWIVAFIYDRCCGAWFNNRRPEASQPDDIHDHVKTRWYLIYKRKPIG